MKNRYLSRRGVVENSFEMRVGNRKVSIDRDVLTMLTVVSSALAALLAGVSLVVQLSDYAENITTSFRPSDPSYITKVYINPVDKKPYMLTRWSLYIKNNGAKPVTIYEPSIYSKRAQYNHLVNELGKFSHSDNGGLFPMTIDAGFHRSEVDFIPIELDAEAYEIIKGIIPDDGEIILTDLIIKYSAKLHSDFELGQNSEIKQIDHLNLIKYPVHGVQFSTDDRLYSCEGSLGL